MLETLHNFTCDNCGKVQQVVIANNYPIDWQRVELRTDGCASGEFDLCDSCFPPTKTWDAKKAKRVRLVQWLLKKMNQRIDEALK